MAAQDDVERVGELLIEEGIVTHEEVVDSLKAAGRSLSPLARLLLGANPVRRRELAAFLAMDVEVPHVDLDVIESSPNAIPLLPESVARKHEVIPLERFDRLLCVAKANVLNRAAVQEIRKLTGLKVKVFRADEDKILAALDRIYGAAPATDDLSLPLTGDAAPAPAAAGGNGPLEAIPVRAGDLTPPPAAEPATVRRVVDEWERLYASRGPLPAERVA